MSFQNDKTLLELIGGVCIWVVDLPEVHLSQNLHDFIERFTTTFLHTHSWLNLVDEDDDEDEVGLKEKPEDTRYIKKITSKWDPNHRESGQRNLIPTFAIIGTADSEKCRCVKPEGT